MATKQAYNKKNSAVKRILQEALELSRDPCTDYTAAPTEDNLFQWHATLRGAPGTDWEGGLYHVRIQLPAEYPFKAPDLLILTPNGRFECNKKICIDGLTSFHQGSWQPAWGIRTAIVGLQSFWQQAKGEAMQSVGALETQPEERRRLAKLSRSWKCTECEQTCLEMLPDPSPASAASTSSASTVIESSPSIMEKEGKTHAHIIPTLDPVPLSSAPPSADDTPPALAREAATSPAHTVSHPDPSAPFNSTSDPSSPAQKTLDSSVDSVPKPSAAANSPSLDSIPSHLFPPLTPDSLTPPLTQQQPLLSSDPFAPPYLPPPPSPPAPAASSPSSSQSPPPPSPSTNDPAPLTSLNETPPRSAGEPFIASPARMPVGEKADSRLVAPLWFDALFGVILAGLVVLIGRRFV